MQIKLTEVQANNLQPLLNNKNKADQDFQIALELITGKKFSSASINNGILTIEELPEAEEVKEVSTI